MGTMVREHNDGAARWALVALLVGALAIGFSPILVRWSETGPTATAVWRMGLSLPWLWAAVGWPRNGAAEPLPRGRALWLLVIAGFCFAGDLFVWHRAVNMTSIANATLIPNTAPVFVALGSWLFFGRRVTRVFLVGMVTALVGITLLVGQSFGLSAAQWQGDALALLTALFYAGYLLAVKELRDTMGTMWIMAGSGTISLLFLLPATLLLGEALWPATLVGWAVLWALGLFTQVGGQGLITFAMAQLPATFSSVTLLLQPVLATVLAWLLLGESLGPWQAAGGVVVLLGIILARRGST